MFPSMHMNRLEALDSAPWNPCSKYLSSTLISEINLPRVHRSADTECSDILGSWLEGLETIADDLRQIDCCCEGGFGDWWGQGEGEVWWLV